MTLNNGRVSIADCIYFIVASPYFNLRFFFIFMLSFVVFVICYCCMC